MKNGHLGGGQEQEPPLHPWDEHNRALYQNVHPPDWVNPRPEGRYNLVVLGGGTAGLVAAAGAAGLGAKVALVERHLLGGDCLNVGCVPSKALVRAARAAAEMRGAPEFGVRCTGEVGVDFGVLMERMRRLRAQISPHDSAKRFKDLGIDVFLGNARFSGGDVVEVGEAKLRFAKAVIATGARASAPPIPGLSQVKYHTNETVFSLTTLPKRLAIVGAGPIGCEMAQAFARFGSEVFLVEAEHGVLPKEDGKASEILLKALRREGVRLLCCGKKLEVSKAEGGIRLGVESHKQGYDEVVDELLIATGRAPNVEGLGLETVGIEFDKKGVKVDDHLRTTHPKVFACGDICTPFQFTHAADFMARLVIQNALFLGRKRMSDLIIPWCTYTSPEVAHVGSDGKGDEDTLTQELREVDRAILDGETEGFVRVHLKHGTDKIVGATVVAAHAGEMISELTVAMSAGVGLKKVGAAIHPYPTQAEALRKLGDQFNKTRLTPTIKKLSKKWLAWRR